MDFFDSVFFGKWGKWGLGYGICFFVDWRDKCRWLVVLVKYCRVGMLFFIFWKDVVCFYDRLDVLFIIKLIGWLFFVICVV